MSEIVPGAVVWAWPGLRDSTAPVYLAEVLFAPRIIGNFSSQVEVVPVQFLTGPRAGGTDHLAITHVETASEDERAAALTLFDAPPPPVTGVTLDVDVPAGWKYRPERLRAVADALRPFLAAGVEPLEVAVLALDADVPPPGCSRCDG